VGVRWLDRELLERNPPGLRPAGTTRFDRIWLTGFFISAVVMIGTPTLRAFALATVILGTVGHVLMRRVGGGSRVPVSAFASLLVVPVCQFIATASGGSNPVIGSLNGAPIGDAAATRLVPWLACAAWILGGIWPWHGLIFPLIAPLAAVLLLRLGAQVFPAAMDHWSPAFMPLALLGTWHVAASRDGQGSGPRRLVEILVALAFFGAFAGGAGVTGAWWLIGAAALVPWLTGGSLQGWLDRTPLAEVGWLPLAWGALLVITGGLATQVTYTVLAAAGIAAAIWVYLPSE
jgi:hypothetical protein